MARSIWDGSRVSIGRSSTPSDGAAAWRAPNSALPAGLAGFPDYDGARQLRRDLLEELQPLSAQIVFEIHETGGVASRLGQRIDDTGTDRIGNAHKYDRQRVRRLLQFQDSKRADSKDHVRSKCNQFRRVFAIVVDIIATPPDIDSQITAGTPAQAVQRFLQCRETAVALSLCGRIGENREPPHPLSLLRTRQQGQRKRTAAKQCDELASPHELAPGRALNPITRAVCPSQQISPVHRPDLRKRAPPLRTRIRGVVL